jgi:hypothetical protein
LTIPTPLPLSNAHVPLPHLHITWGGECRDGRRNKGKGKRNMGMREGNMGKGNTGMGEDGFDCLKTLNNPWHT